MNTHCISDSEFSLSVKNGAPLANNRHFGTLYHVSKKFGSELKITISRLGAFLDQWLDLKRFNIPFQLF